MIIIRKPSADLIRRFLAGQSQLECTYAEVGATATTTPAGYVVDHTRVELGAGEAVFQRARQALMQWKHFELGWAEAWPTNTPIRAGESVAVVIRALGVWWLNSARIVYTVDERVGDVWRFGFAYGTLPGHVEAGEERFLIEWDGAGGNVWYDIFAFSRPRHLLTRMGRWQVRRMQRRFHEHSAAAMMRAIGGERSEAKNLV